MPNIVRSGLEKSLESHILYGTPSCEQSNDSYFAVPSCGVVGSVLDSRLMRCGGQSRLAILVS